MKWSQGIVQTSKSQWKVWKTKMHYYNESLQQCHYFQLWSTCQPKLVLIFTQLLYTHTHKLQHNVSYFNSLLISKLKTYNTCCNKPSGWNLQLVRSASLCPFLRHTVRERSTFRMYLNPFTSCNRKLCWTEDVNASLVKSNYSILWTIPYATHFIYDH